ncbi:glycosyltransferase family 2 protein [Hymenobacter sp. CRA2]|uniref:glycosyltransferase family 2 protein n=1 Tax=Hymenobacter sp. CRA2 TaxID=1955620 RepID=UPI0009CFD1C2|nr:glycosyltransferase family 2 protein [Hymenobacter sp. CRA2]OON67169.1 hypothetical protein B0919_18750 [Hymenobacter sp. CRA2]
MTPPLVSVIIPTYNRGAWVAAAIRSALAQSYPCTQIIVIDDGSTDDTRTQVAAFEGVEYYYQANAGQAAARNAGLRHCIGTYVASLDSDDTWSPDFLTAGVAAMQKHALDFVFLNWTASNGHNGLESFLHLPERRQRYCAQSDAEWWLLEATQTRQLFIETCPAPSSSLLLRRADLPPSAWNESMRIADDWCLMLDLVLSRPRRGAFTTVAHWQKTVHGGNIYDGRDPLAVIQELGFHDEKQLVTRFQHQLKAPERAVFRQRLARNNFEFAYHNWKVRNPTRTVVRHLTLAFALAPLIIFRHSLKGLLGHLKKQQWLTR